MTDLQPKNYFKGYNDYFNQYVWFSQLHMVTGTHAVTSSMDRIIGTPRYVILRLRGLGLAYYH